MLPNTSRPEERLASNINTNNLRHKRFEGEPHIAGRASCEDQQIVPFSSKALAHQKRVLPPTPSEALGSHGIPPMIHHEGRNNGSGQYHHGRNPSDIFMDSSSYPATPGFGYVAHPQLPQPGAPNYGFGPQYYGSPPYQSDPNWNMWHNRSMKTFANSNAVPSTPTHMPGHRNFKKDRRGLPNQRNMTFHEAPQHQQSFTSTPVISATGAQRKIQCRSNSSAQSTGSKARQPCPNSGVTTTGYVPCSCNACKNRNKSVHVKLIQNPTTHPTDILARLKNGLGRLFGPVDEVYMTPSNKVEPSTFLAR